MDLYLRDLELRRMEWAIQGPNSIQVKAQPERTLPALVHFASTHQPYDVASQRQVERFEEQDGKMWNITDVSALCNCANKKLHPVRPCDAENGEIAARQRARIIAV